MVHVTQIIGSRARIWTHIYLIQKFILSSSKGEQSGTQVTGSLKVPELVPMGGWPERALEFWWKPDGSRGWPRWVQS